MDVNKQEAITGNVLPGNVSGGSSPPSQGMLDPGSVFVSAEECRDSIVKHKGNPSQMSKAKNSLPGISKEDCFFMVDFLKEQHALARHNDVLYMLCDSIYRFLDEGTFFNYIFEFSRSVGYTPLHNDVSFIFKELSMRIPNVSCELNDERYTFCRNGYFNNQEGRMERFVPSDYFATIILKGAYLGPGPQYHPLMDKFLATLFNGDPILIARAWEILGYLISSDANAKRLFIFYGPSGDNGKSAMIRLINGLLEGMATEKFRMQDLLGIRFSLSALKGKRINFSADDTINISRDAISKLKQITGHDMITADKKFSDPVTFLCTCKIVVAGNDNIGLAYSCCDSAIKRRICTLPFNVKIPRENQIPNIEKMILANELDQITTEALNAFIRLKNNDYKFTGDDTGLDDYAISFTPVNPQYDAVRDFVDTCIEQDSECFTLTQILFEAFTQKYGCNIFKDITGFSQALGRDLDARGYCYGRGKIHEGNGFHGIMLR